jgi:hypothetical protein
MSVKMIGSPRFGTLKFGRHRPPTGRKLLRFRDYASAELPSPPETFDYTENAQRALNEMYLNDQLGDCCIAGGAHLFGVLNENARGNPSIYTNAEIISLYSAIGGYVPGDPSTDNGCDEQTALNYMVKPGWTGHRAVGWVTVDATNITEVKTALWLFENLYFGIELPDAWISPNPPNNSGFIWDVAGDPDPNNGHCVVGAACTSAGVKIGTWGMTGTMTYAAVSKYAASPSGELYTVISEEGLAKATHKTPAGFDFAQLSADFETLGGQLSE